MHTLCSLSCIGIYLNKHYFCCIHWLSYYLYSVIYSVIKNAGKNSKSAIVQIQNSTLFREIQTSTMTFIAYLTHFRLISTQSKIPTEFPQALGDSSQSPYPSHTHTHGNPHGNPHTHGSPGYCPPIRGMVYGGWGKCSSKKVSIFIPPLTLNDQQQFTIRSGVLTGNDIRWRSASSGNPLAEWMDFGTRSLKV